MKPPMSVMTNADLNKITPSASSIPVNDKPDKPSLVELKNGKLVFKQKSLSFEKMSETLQEIVKFREMLEERLAAREPPLKAIPDEHKPVIAKLVHESEKTLQALSKHIQQELSPALDEDDDEDNPSTHILPVETVESAIKLVAKRVNYGLDSPEDGGKVPAAWHIWRWELLESCREWLPKNAKEKADNRLRERLQAKKDVRSLFESLPEVERMSILGTKSNLKTPLKARNAPKPGPEAAIIDLCEPTPSPTPGQAPQLNGDLENSTSRAQDGEDVAPEGSEKKSVSRPKKPVDPEKAAEKAAKEKERLDKKAAKVEREKKAQAAQAKSRSIMASFFGKAKATASGSPSKPKGSKDVEGGSPGHASVQNDFQRTFRPFALKKDAELAPSNWFRERKQRERRKRRHDSRTEGNVIVIDDDDDVEQDEQDDHSSDVEMTEAEILDPHERLRDTLARLSPGLNPPTRFRQPTGYKTYNPLSVRGLMSQLSEAEVAGDDTEVRRLLALLRNRKAIPAKVLVFHEDVRPGYFGTFTRCSREIGARTPFAKDPVQVDYGYDSGEEWAEEDAGDADDVVEDAEEDGDGDEDEDSDLDSWLVDDDDVEDPGTPIEERGGSPGFPDLDLPQAVSGGGKRKATEKEREKAGGGKKRRVVVPLVPFVKGPQWETSVGRCSYEPFKAYRIQLFNDTPFPIDPFRFVSQPVEQTPGAGSRSAAGPGQTPLSQGQTADGFVIPALPPHIAKVPSHLAASSSGSNVSAGAAPKRATLNPKTAFPEAHLPHLLARIDELATSSLQGIVETVHRELQTHKVKKNAIEAKVREVGEKCKEKKVWVVKAEVRAQQGLS